MSVEEESNVLHPRLCRSLVRPVAGVVATVLLSVGIGGCGSGSGSVPLAPAPPFPEATQTQLNAALNKTRAALKIPGVIVSLYIPGEGLWERAVGVSDKATQAPMVAGMHTRVGSITKTFTVTAILQLADVRPM
jgi:D-alanyl-D-alanine carboxypeptidase